MGPSPVTVLRRWSDDEGTHRGFVLVNRDTGADRELRLDLAELRGEPRLYRPGDDGPGADGQAASPSLRLAPAEVALVAEVT
jgi:hypothetical protein